VLLLVIVQTLLVYATLRRAQQLTLTSIDEGEGRRLAHRTDDWKVQSIRAKKRRWMTPKSAKVADVPSLKNKDPDLPRAEELPPDHTATRTIRSWGSNVTTTPLIFVHIGKAGGGGVRARFAAARPDFTSSDWRTPDANASYSVRQPRLLSDGSTTNSTDVTKAYFCNSGHATFRSTQRSLYEETLVCSATTPLGAALACPDHFQSLQTCARQCGPNDTACHQVYVGHNIVGAEWHWLPYKVLTQWWQDQWAHQVPAALSQAVLRRLQTLQPSSNDWCPYHDQGLPRPVDHKDYRDKLLPCSVPLAQVADHLAHQARLASLAHDHSHSVPGAVEQPMEDWSPFYASLPVLRTTLVREPYSWLVSKFFWMGNYHWWDMECSDVEAATRMEPMASAQRRRLTEDPEPQEDGNSDASDGTTDDAWGEVDGGVDEAESKRERNRRERVFPVSHRDSTVVIDGDGWGWANRYALLYIFYLCGEDCAARYEMGLGSLDQLEFQAANNLRQSFAVVGLLHETETYYDMLTARVQYLDMGLHPAIEGERHDTGATDDNRRCKDLFHKPSFQEKLRQASPAVAALERLYQVAVEVNRHQLRELAAASSVDPVVRQRLQDAVSALH
jgi:hypothetical protein